MKPINIGRPGTTGSFRLENWSDIMALAGPFLLMPMPALALLIKLSTRYNIFKLNPRFMEMPKAYVAIMLGAGILISIFGIFAIFKSVRAASSGGYNGRNDKIKWGHTAFNALVAGVPSIIFSSLALKNVEFGKNAVIEDAITSLIIGSIILIILVIIVVRNLEKTKPIKVSSRDDGLSDRETRPIQVAILNARGVKGAIPEFAWRINGGICITTDLPDNGQKASVSIDFNGIELFLQTNPLLGEDDLNSRITRDENGFPEVKIFITDVFISNGGKHGCVVTRTTKLECNALSGNRDQDIKDMRNLAIEKEQEYTGRNNRPNAGATNFANRTSSNILLI